MSAQTLLLTGGAGFIGSHLADAFLDAGHTVHIVDDLSTGRRGNVPEGATLHELDIRSGEAARLIAEIRPRTVVHQAAQMDVRRSTADPAFDAEVNILGLLNVVTSAIEAGARKVLFASTGGAIYGEQDVFPAAEDHPTRPVSPYGVSKLAGERYLYYFHASHGIDVTCLRYANVYGPRQNPFGEAGVVAIFCRRLLDGDVPVINGDGLQTRDYVHVSDVVAANLAALDGPEGFQTFNVGTGVETTVVELYQEIARALDLEVAPRHGPAKPGEQRRSSISPERAIDELGLPRPLTLAEGLTRTATWFSEEDRSEH